MLMSSKKKIRVAVIVPAYNEASVVREVIKNAKKTFDKSEVYSVDIIVINDGSTDSTAQEAELGGAIVINHVINSGAGSATATGLSYATQKGYVMAATMDADGQHAPSDVLNGFSKLPEVKCDLLIGSRLIDNTGMSRVKILGNKILSIFTYLLFGVISTDSQSGLRIYSKRALEKLRWNTNGYEFCSEMLWRAKQLNLKISEYSIKAIYTDYSKGKGQNNWNAINIIKSLLQRRIMEIFGE